MPGDRRLDAGRGLAHVTGMLGLTAAMLLQAGTGHGVDWHAMWPAPSNPHPNGYPDPGPPPPPWRSAAPIPLTGSEWTIGRTVAQLRVRLRPDIALRPLGTTTEHVSGLIDAHTGRCIVTFYLKPGIGGDPVVWKVEGVTNGWAPLGAAAAACSASLLKRGASNR